MDPFLKWAGGKRWFFRETSLQIPTDCDTYFEPFVGAGAAFFAIRPHKATLSDLNPELINLYQQIRDRPQAISQGLDRCQRLHSKPFYYEMRAKAFSPDAEGAVRTLYLNRTCWNGLYRLNLKGHFNVPIGTKNRIFLPNEDFTEYAALLSNANLRTCDFEETLSSAKAGDFAFIDPPYTVKHNLNGFVKYNESIFSWDDQVRLRDSVVRAVRRGVRIWLTNADHDSIRGLYANVGEITSLNRHSVISGHSKGRAPTTELLLVA